MEDKDVADAVVYILSTPAHVQVIKKLWLWYFCTFTITYT